MGAKFRGHVVALCLISLSMGCGSQCTVTGKVTFADGTPLTEGQVVFESAALTAKGNIMADGSYSMNAGSDTGIPKGAYQISISGFGTPKTESVLGPDGKPQGVRVTHPPSPIDKKFYAPATSGLTCEVNGRTKYNITVEPPIK
jgi:hypothetical protein